MSRKFITILVLLSLGLSSCEFNKPAVTPLPANPPALPIITNTSTPTANDVSLSHFPSKAKFQVFILNPVRVCLAGNDFSSGNVCYGEKCSDCSCLWEDFDPPAPMTGIPPERINDPEYAGYAYHTCLNITLSEQEVAEIKEDMQLVSEKVYKWSEGALELEMSFTELAFDHTGFTAPDFVFGPFEVDDELLNPYVGVDTDFVYVVTGVYDREQQKNLAYWCGGSYGEMSIHGASYSYIQFNDICNSVLIGGEQVYEPLIHEWYHNLDWALLRINKVWDIYEGMAPDWATWERKNWPACGSGGDPKQWFPSIDYCEWDPDWIDCTNTTSAGMCPHAGEVDGQMSWYEHVIREHYPGAIQYIGNFCRDGRQDFGETGVDSGGACP